MAPLPRPIAIGVDGAPAGWFGATLHADALRHADARTWSTRMHLWPDVAALARYRDEAGGRAPVAIDVPIGLLDAVAFRACDAEARRRLGPRGSSVFAPPARYMLAAAGDFAAIRALVERERARDPAAKGISAQAAGIARKVAEVDAWVRAHRDSDAWLFECHPELSFGALRGSAAVAADKRSPAGAIARLRRVRAAFPDAEERLAAAPWRGGQVALADALDAYAALATAVRIARGEAETLGGGERDRHGVPMRIVL